MIKNVAGYDLSKLFTGAFGTLGLIAQVAVRLHPRPPQALTARGIGDDADRLAAAASALAHRPLEAECLDVAWSDGRGAVLARFGGATAQRGAETSATVLREHGCEADVVEDDAGLWQRQREHQRSTGATVVKVSGLPADLPKALRAADALGGTLVGRAALGLWWITLPGGAEAVAEAARGPDAGAVRGRRRARGRAQRRGPVAHRRRRAARAPTPASSTSSTPPASATPASTWAASDARPDRRLRPLRVLPAHVPDLPALGRGDGLAARAHRPHGRAREHGHALGRHDHPLRPLPRVHGLRDRLPVGRPVRQAHHHDAGPGAGERQALAQGAAAAPRRLRALHPPRSGCGRSCR